MKKIANFVLGCILVLLITSSNIAHAVEPVIIPTDDWMYEYRGWPLQIFYTSNSIYNSNYIKVLPPSIELVKKSLLQTIERTIATLGYKHPARTADKHIIVKVEDGGFKRTIPEDAVGMAQVIDGFPWLYVDNTHGSELIDKTIAHEFFHLIQFSYDPQFFGTYEQLNFSEGTAMWMERLMFEFEKYAYKKDYLNYYASYYKTPNYSLYGTNLKNKDFQYSTVLWAIFLEDKFNRDVIREIWEEYFEEVSRSENYYTSLYKATDTVLKKRNSSIERAYRDFAGWIYDKDIFRRDAKYYPDVDTYKIKELWKLYEFGGENVAPYVLGSTYLEFDIYQGDFYLDFEGASDAKWAIDFYSHGSGTAYKSIGSGTIPIGTGKKTFKLPEKYINNDLVAIISPIDAVQIDTEKNPFEFYYPFQIIARYETTSSEVEEKEATTDTQTTKICEINKTWDYSDYCVCPKGYRDNGHRQCIKSGSTTSSNDTQITSANHFSDISENYSYKKAINYVKENGIVNGYSDGTYKPNNKINRAEFTKILTVAAFGDSVSNYVYPYTQCFLDVEPNAWYAPYVCYAFENKIIQGYTAGKFGPDRNINVAEALKITLEVFIDNIPEATGAWYQKYWNYAKNNNYLLSEWYNPSNEITRGELAELIYRIKSKSE